MEKLFFKAGMLAVLFALSVMTLSGCVAFIPYSSSYEPSKSRALRTELNIINGDNVSMNKSRRYCILSAVDYNKKGDKTYYLIITPTKGITGNRTLSSVYLNYNYPYYLPVTDAAELIKNGRQMLKEWDEKLSFNGAVYNFYGPTSDVVIYDGPRYRLLQKQCIRFESSKDNDTGTLAKLELGYEQTTIIFGEDKKEEVRWTQVPHPLFLYYFDTKENASDLINLLEKGIADLRGRGMK